MRDKILDGQIERRDYNDQDVYEFLKLLK